jgi:hypothetical protein
MINHSPNAGLQKKITMEQGRDKGVRLSIKQLIPGKFEAITIAKYVRDNAVKYLRLPEFHGQCFCKIKITDARFEPEILFVASGSL